MYLVHKCNMYIQYSYDFTVFTLPSNWISRLFLSGSDEVGIEKKRSVFFQRTKSSLVLRRDEGKCY
jgi:hypothetical protein